MERNKLSKLGLAMGLAMMTAGHSAWAMSLQEAVQTSVKSYPSIQKAMAGRQAIAGDLDVAKSRYLPTIDFEFNYGREWSDNPTTRGRAAAGNQDDRWMNRRDASLTLTQTLYDGTSRTSEVERQNALLQGAGFNISDVAETLAADVVFSYIDVVRYRETLKLAEENLQIHTRILEDVRGRVDAGQSGIGDLQQARSREANSKARIAEVQLDFDKAKIAFNKMVGAMPEGLSRPKFDDERLPGSVEEAIQRAMESNPLVHRSQAQVDAAKADQSGARAGFYPTVLFEMRATDNHDIDGSNGSNEDMTALLKFRMNLYRGGADAAREKAAVERHSESMSSLSESRRQIEEEVRRAWAAKMRQDEEVLGRFDQVMANGQVVETYRQEFEVGQRDLLDLLDSENELYISRTQLIAAESSALYARYLLMATMGTLTKDLEVTLPEAEVAAN
ncbi:MAG: TolC family outer membrane protein [Candidatus Sedimenticola sp. 20ELBAFRAG]